MDNGRVGATYVIAYCKVSQALETATDPLNKNII